MRGIDEMPEALETPVAETAVVAVPAREAQHVAELLVGSGVGTILDLAPVGLSRADGAVVRNVDLTDEPESLVFDAARRSRAAGRESARGS